MLGKSTEGVDINMKNSVIWKVGTKEFALPGLLHYFSPSLSAPHSLPNHMALLKLLILSELHDRSLYSDFSCRECSKNPVFLLPTWLFGQMVMRTIVKASIHAAKGCDFLLSVSHWYVVLLNWIKSFSMYSHHWGRRCGETRETVLSPLRERIHFSNASLETEGFVFWGCVCSQGSGRYTGLCTL